MNRRIKRKTQKAKATRKLFPGATPQPAKAPDFTALDRAELSNGVTILVGGAYLVQLALEPHHTKLQLIALHRDVAGGVVGHWIKPGDDSPPVAHYMDRVSDIQVELS